MNNRRKTEKRHSGRRPEKTIYVILMLLAAGAAIIAGWQFRVSSQENDVSDEQIDMKPVPAPGDPEDKPMNFNGMRAENPDIIGWITIKALGIDYPIVQGSDNVYYLTHTAQRKTNRIGALFLDFRSRGDFSDFNSVVYGHYLKSGRMFQPLRRMRDQETFDRVTEGTLYTPGKTYRLEFFASVLASSTSEFYSYIFPSRESRQAHLNSICGQAVCYRDIGVTADDRLLLLSTCSYEYEGARTLVAARIAE